MSGLGLRRRTAWTIAPLGHELVELGLVLGHAQAGEEIAELALFLLESAQRVRAVLVEGTIAARARLAPPVGARTRALGALGLIMPAAEAAIFPATHSSAPYGEHQDRKTNRPPEDEAEDHQRDPGGVSQFVEFRSDGHERPRVVNVNNINIAMRGRKDCQAVSRRRGAGAGFGLR